MSVAERVYPPAAAAGASPNAAIDNILRLALNGPRPQPSSRRAQPDFTAAADLLERATSAFTSMAAQRAALEENVAKLQDALARQERAFAEKATALQVESADWERRAKVVKEQLTDVEARLADQQSRADALTERAERAEARAHVAEAAATEAHRLVQAYHDRIFGAFSSLV